jgi:hypothetical protein
MRQGPTLVVQSDFAKSERIFRNIGIPDFTSPDQSKKGIKKSSFFDAKLAVGANIASIVRIGEMDRKK